MPPDGDAVRRACRGTVIEGRQFCRAELERFRKAAADAETLVVACTQEAPLFREVASEVEGSAPLSFVNIRETGGWSRDAAKAGPKMAALIAAAAEPAPDIPFVPMTSEGITLIYGRDEQAIEAANLLKDQLDVTVLIRPDAKLAPSRVTEFPVVKGVVRAAKGYLGAFEITVDDYAAPNPSSRAEFEFGHGRNGATSLLICRAIHRYSRPGISETATCVPIRAIPQRFSALCSRRVTSPAHSTNRVT
jgi:hypothetical protein